MKLPTLSHGSAVLALGFTLATALAACNATPNTSAQDHWNARGVGPSLTRAFLGYEPERDGRYVDYQYANKKAINLTLSRHLLNHNPENPFQYEDKAFYAPRPPHSLLPRPWEYIHFEGLAWGGILAGATGGVFLPIPVDSVIGTMSEGGNEEFSEGIRQAFETRKAAPKTASFLHEAVGLAVRAAPRAH